MVAASHDAVLAVNGQNLHIEISGASGPTIVFEAGLGNDSTTWKLVAGPIAQLARVVMYDRAGLGQSLPMKNKDSAITADEVATNLHALHTTAAGLSAIAAPSNTRKDPDTPPLVGFWHLS